MLRERGSSRWRRGRGAAPTCFHGNARGEHKGGSVGRKRSLWEERVGWGSLAMGFRKSPWDRP